MKNCFEWTFVYAVKFRVGFLNLLLEHPSKSQHILVRSAPKHRRNLKKWFE